MSRAPFSPTARRSRIAWLSEKPFTLVLGAGFFGFFAHTGVLQALEAEGLVPQRVIGVSAGALAGGAWSAGLLAPALEKELVGLQRQDFWDPGLPLGGVLRGDKFAARLKDVLSRTGVERFDQCRIPFATVVHDIAGRRPVVLDRGDLASAIQASCTVPVMFRPVRIAGRWVVDGGVSDRPGFSALRPAERILVHDLASGSPWRVLYRHRKATVRADRAMMRLQVPDLPRVTPFALQHGPRALRHAREFAQRWLRQAIPSPFI